MCFCGGIFQFEFTMEMKDIDNTPEVEKETENPTEETGEKTEETVKTDSESLLKPGRTIKPNLSNEEVTKLAMRLYGIQVKEMTGLPAYDDQNFFLMEDNRYKNPIITNHCPHGYVLKILNALDSQKIPFIDAQTKLMRFVHDNDIICPKPIPNVYGKMYSLETHKRGGGDHVIRLLEYIPGKMLKDVPYTDNLFYQAGIFIARFDKVIKKFEHEGYKSHRSIWQMDNVCQLEEFVYVLKDEEKQMIVEDVLAEFKKTVVPQINTFEIGLIHGDFNEHNILVTKNGITKQYYVSGILDFGDTSYSHYVFEVAIAMTYLMLTSSNLKAGGLVLAGYESIRPMPKAEKQVLKVNFSDDSRFSNGLRRNYATWLGLWCLYKFICDKTVVVWT